MLKIYLMEKENVALHCIVLHCIVMLQMQRSDIRISLGVQSNFLERLREGLKKIVEYSTKGLTPPFKHQMSKSKSSLKVSLNVSFKLQIYIYIYTSTLNSNVILHQFKLQIQSSNSIFSFQP